jgi:hypothetical protein
MVAINLDRDMLWIPRTEAPLTWSTEVDIDGSPYECETNGVIAPVHAFAHLRSEATLSGAGKIKCFGVQVSGPEDLDWTPYRVKAQGNGVDASSLVVGFGYVGEGPGPSITVSGPKCIGGLNGAFMDQVVCVEPNPIPDEQADEPICFFIGCMAAGHYLASISVQRLVGKPNTYATAVS